MTEVYLDTKQKRIYSDRGHSSVTNWIHQGEHRVHIAGINELPLHTTVVKIEYIFSRHKSKGFQMVYMLLK